VLYILISISITILYIPMEEVETYTLEDLKKEFFEKEKEEYIY
jgi:hypothetical protein